MAHTLTHIAKIYNKTMTLQQQNNLQKTIEFLEEIEAKLGCVRMNFDRNMGPPGLGSPQAAPTLPLGPPGLESLATTGSYMASND